MASRNTAILSIRIVANSARATAGLRKTSRNVAALQRDFARLNQTGFPRLLNSLGRVAALGTLVAGAITSAGAAVGALAAGAVAASVAVGPALVAIMMGFEGIKNAAKQVQPQFDALKSAISGVFERELAPGMQMLGGLMDSLTGSMMNLASVISTEFNLVIGLLSDSEAKLQQLTLGSAEFVTGFGVGIRDLIQGLVDFGAAAQPAMQQFGDSLSSVLGVIGEVLTRFSEMGKVPALMDSVSQVFDGFADLLGSVLTVVLDLVTAIGPSLGQAFTSIGDALEAISPALATFGEQFAVTLVQAIEALLPSLPQLLQGFERVLDILTLLLPVIGPLAGFIARNIDVFMILAVVLKVVTVAVAALNFVLLANPIMIVVLAAMALIGVIYLLATRTQYFQTIWQNMCTVAVAVWDWVVNTIKTVWDAIWSAIQTVAQAVLTAIQAYIQAWVIVITTIWEGLKIAAQFVWDGIKAYIQTAMSVATTIIEAFKSAASAAWEAIKSVATSVWDGIKSAIETAINRATNVVNVFKSAGSTAFNAVKSAANGVRSAISAIVGAVQSVINWLGRIRFPSPPGWISRMMGGFGAAEFKFTPVEAMRFVPQSYQMFADRGPEISAAATYGTVSPAALGGLGGNHETNVTNVNITVEGAIDPVGTANQIKRLLDDTDRRVGVKATSRW